MYISQTNLGPGTRLPHQALFWASRTLGEWGEDGDLGVYPDGSQGPVKGCALTPEPGAFGQLDVSASGPAKAKEHLASYPVLLAESSMKRRRHLQLAITWARRGLPCPLPAPHQAVTTC